MLQKTEQTDLSNDENENENINFQMDYIRQNLLSIEDPFANDDDEILRIVNRLLPPILRRSSAQMNHVLLCRKFNPFTHVCSKHACGYPEDQWKVATTGKID